MLIAISYPRPVTSRHARRGAILLIVLTLLALFAVVGLSFVLFSDAEATAARIRREAENTDTLIDRYGTPDSAPIANLFLGKLLYPQGDGYTGDALLSALRGYDMTTMVYGNKPGVPNTVAYNGLGQAQQTFAANTLPNATGTIGATVERRDIIAYNLVVPRTAAGAPNFNNRHVIDPEHLNFRNAAATAAVPPAANAYVGRNAPYTYPDRNNAYLAVQNPSNGRILVPSFHRPLLFRDPSMAANLSDLDPSNPNWTNDIGRYKILRPRPADHRYDDNGSGNYTTAFPFPPQNPDGSYTGDVQNITGTNGQQRNDAVWIDANLPTFTWRGRTVKPLVAPTILALDGRVNVNVARGANNAANPNNVTAISNQGFGPWEINLGRVMGSTPSSVQAQNMTTSRMGTLAGPGNTPWYTASTNTHAFPPTDTANNPPAYSQVVWNPNSSITQAVTLPPTGSRTDPDYSTIPAPNTLGTQHPGLFSPMFWTSHSFPAYLYPDVDLRRAAVRYSGTKEEAPYFGTNKPSALDTTGPNDSSNPNRALITTRSNSLNVARLMPNFPDYTAANSGQLIRYVVPDPSLMLPPPYPGFTTTAPVGTVLYLREQKTLVAPTAGSERDLTSPTDLQARTQLPALDLNRPLADYRNDTNLALSVTNIANASNAANARQSFARDIFARLIVATGATATVNASTNTIILPQPGGMPGPYVLGGNSVSQEEYDALIYLAQLAANIVDYIDDDDITTTFVWNPNQTGLTAAEVTRHFGRLDVIDSTSLVNVTNNFDSTNQPLRVVYGVERPRVVLNEVYAEVTNANGDTTNEATQDFQVRFWVELCNPTNNGGTATAPLGDGKVTLAYAGQFSPYKIQVYSNGTEVRTALHQPITAATPAADRLRSLTGRLDTLTSRVIDVTLPVPAPPMPPSMTPTDTVIEPNNGSTGFGTATGFRVVGPDITGLVASTANEFNPNPMLFPEYNGRLIVTPNGLAPPAVAMPAAVSTTLAYQTTRQIPSALTAAYFDTLRDHAVVLRRTANPYLPANDPLDGSFNSMLPVNPYVTVDVVSDVAVQDAINVGAREGMNGMRPQGGGLPTTAANLRSSKGRQAPYYGTQLPVAGPVAAPTYFVAQNLGTTSPNGQLLTLLDHNSNFNQNAVTWLPHMDRKLINTMELLHVPAVKPHELTHAFTNPTTTSFGHVAPWHQMPTTANPSPMPLYRALELLDTKPWGYGIGHGGRVAGKININMIWDSPIRVDDGVNPVYYRSQVLEALLDKNSTNAFTDLTATSDVQRVYNMLFGPPSAIHARTKFDPATLQTSDRPGNTVDEVDPTQASINAADRPFKPFGLAQLRSVATTMAPGPTSGAFAYAQQGAGLQDTILRSANPGAANPIPAIFTADQHPYRQAEMLRKIYNNITTTSDTFLVVMTVGFFEVRNPGPFHVNNPTILGRELFLDTPGDMRTKFAAIIDRSMLATTSPTAATGQQPTNHFYSELTSDLVIPANTTTMDQNNITLTATVRGQTQLGADVIYEGQQVRLGTGGVTALYFGSGPERLYLDNLTATSATDVITLQRTNYTVLANSPQRIIPRGTVVSSAAPGNPGEQFFFDATTPQFRGVVPYFEKIPNR